MHSGRIVGLGVVVVGAGVVGAGVVVGSVSGPVSGNPVREGMFEVLKMLNSYVIRYMVANS